MYIISALRRIRGPDKRCPGNPYFIIEADLLSSGKRLEERARKGVESAADDR